MSSSAQEASQQPQQQRRLPHQQQQQQQPPLPPPPLPVASSTPPAAEVPRSQQPLVVEDSLVCQWEKCTERCASPEALYEHICERHIGRKSTNNLNLTCGWNLCCTTTVKRDHITSHVRVHVPLKPHKCDFCGKSFKRPQDLKKHVKTHADDPVLLRSPDQHGGQGGGYRTQGKATSTGFYGPMHQVSNANYGQNAQGGSTGQNGFYTQQQNSYGTPVYYNVSQGGDSGQQMPFENRRRGAGFDVLNDFFGDAKRRQFDPGSYNQVGQRLIPLHGIPIQGGTLVDYIPASPMVAVGSNGQSSGPAMSHPPYVLPIPNLRTKNDLVNIDNFLDQMQSTVYESSTAATTAGAHQTVSHYATHGINFRQSNSPPQAASHNVTSSMGAQDSNVTATAPTTSVSSHSPQSGTPALTPPSATTSYTSGQSPSSMPGRSPISKHTSTASTSYPILPTVTSGFLPQPSGAAVSALGTNFECDPHRHYSVGILQQGARTSPATEETEGPDDASLPPPEKSSDPTVAGIDPALSDESSSAYDNSESARDRDQEIWVENIRVIEALRKFINDRLENHQYEEDDSDMETSESQTNECVPASKTNETLYPLLRATAE